MVVRVSHLVYRLVAKRRGRARPCRYVGVVKVRGVRDLWGLALHEEVLRRRACAHTTGKGGTGAKWLKGCELLGEPCLVEAVEGEREAYRAELFWALADRKVHPEDSRGGPYSSPKPRVPELEEIASLNKWTRHKLDTTLPFCLPVLARRSVLQRCLNCGQRGHYAPKCRKPWTPQGPELPPTPAPTHAKVDSAKADEPAKPRGRPRLEAGDRKKHLSGAQQRRKRLDQASRRSQKAAALAAIRKNKKQWNLTWNTSAGKKAGEGEDEDGHRAGGMLQACAEAPA